MVGAWDTQGLPLWPSSPQIEHCPHGWQICAIQSWAPIPGTCHTDETVEGRNIGDGRGEDAKTTTSQTTTQTLSEELKDPRLNGIALWMPTKLVDCLPAKLMVVNLVNFIKPNLTSSEMHIFFLNLFTFTSYFSHKVTWVVAIVMFQLIGAAFGAAGQRCMALTTAIFVGESKDWIPDVVAKAKELQVNEGSLSLC